MSHAHDVLISRRTELEREIERAKNNRKDWMREVERATTRLVIAEQQLCDVEATLAKLAELPQL